MDIRELLRTRLTQLDPTLDTTDGSYADRVVMTPVADALSSDVLTTDARDFLLTKYAEAFPSTPVARGDAISDILISAAEVFLAGYRQQLALLRNAQSVSRIDLLSDADADALAANWLVSRARGAAASGTITVTVDRTAPVALDPLITKFFTAGGVEFVPVTARLITSEQLLSGRVAADRFSFDVDVRAVAEGADGNIVAGEIRRAVGAGSVVSVTNRAGFLGGMTGDSTEALLSTKLPRAISERSLVTARGIIARLASSFETIGALQVIGLDDPEMTRDAVSVQSFSDILFSGIARVVGRAVKLSCVQISDTATYASGMRVRLRAPDGRTSTHTIEDTLTDPYQSATPLILDADTDGWVRIDAPPLDGLYYASVLSVDTAVLGGRRVDQRVHLGGRVDVYLKPKDEREMELADTLGFYDRTSIQGRGITRVSARVLDIASIVEAPSDVYGGRLTIGQDVYVVRYAERVAPTTTRAYLTTDAPPSDATATWALALEFGVSLSNSYEQIFPKLNEQTLQVRGRLGARYLDVITNRESAFFLAGVSAGDIITTLSDGSQLVVDHVDGLRLYLSEGLTRGMTTTAARIERARGSMPSPIGLLLSVYRGDTPLPYGKPLGVHISALSDERAPTLVQSGFVAPSLYHALRRLYIARSNTLIGDVLVENAESGYTIVNAPSAEDILVPQTLLPEVVLRNSVAQRYSRSNTQPPLGTSVMLATAQGAVFDNGELIGANAHELLIWNELLCPETRNIFICPLVAHYGDRYLAEPDIISRGDVLRIHDGPNAGGYVIADVVFVELYEDDAATLTQRQGFTGRTARMSNDVSDVRRVALIKIYGEFPYRESEHIEQEIELEWGSPDITFGAAGQTIVPLSLSRIGNFFKGAVRLTYNNLQLGDDVWALSGASPFNAIRNPAAQKSGNAAYAFPQRNFSIVPAARATGSLVTDNNPTCRAHIASQSMVPSAVALRGLRAATPPSTYRTPPLSVAQWGGTELVVTGAAESATEIRYGLTPALFREFVPESVYSHDRMAPQELLNTDVIVLADDPLLFSPTDVTVHEEIYLDGYATLSESTIRLSFAPVLLTDYDLTDDVEIVNVMPTSQVGDMIRLQLARSTSILAARAVQLDWVNSAGVTLRSLLTRYTVFATVMDEQIAPGELLGLGIDHIAERAGGDQFSVRVLIQPESVYRRAVAEVDNTRPVLTLAKVGPSDYDITVLPQMPAAQVSLPAIPSGSIVRLEHKGETLLRKVVTTEGSVLRIDEPITTRDANILAYGLCFYDANTGDVLLGSLQDFAAGGLSPEPTVITGIYQGGASRPLLSSDAGRTQLTLWGLTESYHTLDSDQVDNPRSAFYPVRRHLGTADVISVTSQTAVSPTLGTSYVSSQTIKCSATPWLDGDDLSELSALRRGSYVACRFVLTDKSVALADPNTQVVNLTTVQVFEEIPQTYHIAARSLDGDGSCALTRRRGDVVGPSATRNSMLFNYVTVNGIDVLASYNKNNPYRIVTAHGSSDLEMTALQVVRNPYSATLPITNTTGAGYRVVTEGKETARSLNDHATVLIPFNDEFDTGDTVALRALYSPVISQAQAIVSSDAERAVCSDVVVRRMAPGYVGVTLRYEGGPDEQIMSQRVRDVIQNAITHSAPLAVADIVALCINLGAQRVSPDIEMYICVEDMSRARHRREIHDVADAAAVLHVDATSRITSIEAAPINEPRMGAQIRVTRGILTNTQIGNGGA